MKKNGFTIAEILITLMLIGIIGALSMPTLINGYNKKIYANTLSVAVSDFESAMGTLLTKESVDDLLDTDTWKDINNTLTASSSDNTIKTFMNNISQVFPFTQFTKESPTYKYHRSGNIANLEERGPGFHTRKGVEYKIYINNVSKANAKNELSILNKGGNLINKAATVYIDINGQNTPNKYGRDLFRYILGTDGNLYPYNGHDYCVYNGASSTAYGNNLDVPCKMMGASEWCAAYLEQNNYNMDY